MDLNFTLSGRDLAGLGARLFGNNSLFPFENNTTDSKTDEEDLEVNTDVYSKVIVTVIYAALFAVGTLGNSITLYTLLTKKTLQNLQSTVHYHLASLAVSDLLILVLSMPIELYNFIWFHHPWVFGDAVCRGYYFLRDSCSYATALNITSLSVERYMAICHPFKAKSIMSRSRTKKLISAMWLASFALAMPMPFVMGQVMRKGEKICTAIVSPVTIKTVLQVGVGEVSCRCFVLALQMYPQLVFTHRWVWFVCFVYLEQHQHTVKDGRKRKKKSDKNIKIKQNHVQIHPNPSQNKKNDEFEEQAEA